MKQHTILLLALCGLVLGFGGVAAQDSSPAALATVEPVEDEFEPRLPAHFAKVGIGLKQREQIYDVQRKYAAQIRELERQIAELEEKQSAEIMKLLTERQKRELAEYLKEAEQRREDAQDEEAEETSD